MFSRSFRKHGVVPLAIQMPICKKGVLGIRGRALVKEEHATNVTTMARVAQHAVGSVVNKQIKGKILVKRINVCIEHVKYFKRLDIFLNHVKENDQKKKDAKEKGSWVQLKCQPAPSKEILFVRTNGKVTELLESIPYYSMA